MNLPFFSQGQPDFRWSKAVRVLPLSFHQVLFLGHRVVSAYSTFGGVANYCKYYIFVK
jgi:hypothetical protein